MKTGICGVLTLAAALALLTGCRQSDSQLVQRAKLVGSENIQLKKQLEQKEKEIQALRQQMAEQEQQFQRQQEDTSAAMMAFGDILQQTNLQLEACKAENEQLKQRLAQQQSPPSAPR